VAPSATASPELEPVCRREGARVRQEAKTVNAITKIDASERLLRRREVERLVGMSRSTIYQKVGEGTFPAPVKIGSHAVRWRESNVRRWIAELGMPKTKRGRK